MAVVDGHDDDAGWHADDSDGASGGESEAYGPDDLVSCWGRLEPKVAADRTG